MGYPCQPCRCRCRRGHRPCCQYMPPAVAIVPDFACGVGDFVVALSGKSRLRRRRRAWTAVMRSAPHAFLKLDWFLNETKNSPRRRARVVGCSCPPGRTLPEVTRSPARAWHEAPQPRNSASSPHWCRFVQRLACTVTDRPRAERVNRVRYPLLYISKCAPKTKPKT